MTTVIPGCHIAKCGQVGVTPHVVRLSGVDYNVNITYYCVNLGISIDTTVLF